MWLPDKHAVMAGDICFYKSAGSFIDTLITMRTGSDYVHVAIVTDHNMTTAATSKGITTQPMGGETDIWRPTSFYDHTRISPALGWLDAQLGRPYGYADLANQVLLLAGKNVPLLDCSSDCSDLACKFLWIAGIALPPDLIRTEAVTPGGLYRTLQQIPS